MRRGKYRLTAKWANNPDRIIYFEGENTKAGLPSIDEMVIHNANVHLECQDDSSFMLIVDNGVHHWHFVIFARNGKAKIETYLYEDNSNES